ncbi:hypothetical protein NLI96_g4378 [Meripilus lineatus]|uniref:Uncharacterized protein n=1 Tax=Meripilus lineatus TaxID=2056292 RepID=A0AAD5V798_9APHY|nr:hypothetical protein NLI96_g4378 [Physisporinus lineatus]
MKFPAIVIETSYPTVTLAHSDHEDEKFIDEKRGFVENGVNGHVPLDHKSSLLRPRGRRDEHMKLWGLSLGMTLDLLAFMAPPPAFASVNGNGNGYYATGNEAFVPPDAQTESMGLPVMAPSLTSVFPRFSYPDVNFWIWVFGRRYREVVRGWESSLSAGGTNDRRINWTGSALSTFYSAVRKALVVVIVVRAILVLLGLIMGGWFLFFRSPL